MSFMNSELTEKQKNLLQIISIYINDNKILSSNRELMQLFGVKSTSTMHSYLDRLKEKGYITWKEGMPRTIQILERT